MPKSIFKGGHKSKGMNAAPVRAFIFFAATVFAARAVVLPLTNSNSTISVQAAEAHLGKGYQYLQQERYQEAAKEFQAALAGNPSLVRARYQLAICHFALGHMGQAKTEFESLSSKMPGDPRLDYYLGRIDLVQGKAGPAIIKLRAIAAAPPFADTAYYLGSAYLEAGKLQNAEAWLKRAAASNPKDFRIPDHLARVYQREKKMPESEAAYKASARLHQYYDERSSQALKCEQALNTKPLDQARSVCGSLANRADPDMLTLLGMMYGRHGDYPDALPPLVRAAQMDPQSWEIQHNLGLTYFRLKQYQPAAIALQRAVSMRPDYFGSNALLGASLYALKQDKSAFRVLAHAHQLNPADQDTSSLLFNEALVLGRAAFMAHNYKDCTKFLTIASALHPEDQSIRRKLDQVEHLQSSKSQEASSN